MSSNIPRNGRLKYIKFKGIDQFMCRNYYALFEKFFIVLHNNFRRRMVASTSAGDSSQCVDTSESSKRIFASNNKIQLVEDADAHINQNLTSKNNDPLIV